MVSLNIWLAHLMNSLPHKSLHHICTGHPCTGRYHCSHWGTSGHCSLHQWSVRNTNTFHLHTVPYHCSYWDTPAGCSRLPCSPDGTRTSRPHIVHCRCTHQGRRTPSNLGPPSLGCRHSCRCPFGRIHAHYNLCPLLGKKGIKLLSYGW